MAYMVRDPGLLQSYGRFAIPLVFIVARGGYFSKEYLSFKEKNENVFRHICWTTYLPKLPLPTRDCHL